MKNRNRVPRVTDEQIAAMANTGVSDANVATAVAERSGSDDKVAAAEAEGAKPKVKTLTPEGAEWVNRDPYGLKKVGLYGQRDRFALRYEDLTRRAQFLGRPLTVADLLELHGPDESAPESVISTVNGEPVTSPVRTAMINEEGDLRRDQSGNIVYRGQFVVTGKPLAVHAAHTGDDLYKLRNARNKKKDRTNQAGRTFQVADLLPSQSYEQAQARLAGIQGSFTAKQAQNQAFVERLGFKVGDAARTSGGPNRGIFEPKTPRGQTRSQRRSRWVENNAE